MTDLTEQWRKGELPSRDDNYVWLAYYIKHKDGFVYADSWWSGKWGIADNSSIEAVLAPVPSYEEYQKLLSDQLAKNEGVEINAELEEENTKLRKELKEICEKYLEIKTTVSAYEDACKDLHAYIEKLKELLKECREEIEYLRKHYKGNIDHFKNNTRLDKEINQILGEE